jgi:hypothetical protein
MFHSFCLFHSCHSFSLVSIPLVQAVYQAIDELPVSPDDVAINQYEFEDGVMIASRHRYAKVVARLIHEGGGGAQL